MDFCSYCPGYSLPARLAMAKIGLTTSDSVYFCFLWFFESRLNVPSDPPPRSTHPGYGVGSTDGASHCRTRSDMAVAHHADHRRYANARRWTRASGVRLAMDKRE